MGIFSQRRCAGRPRYANGGRGEPGLCGEPPPRCAVGGGAAPRYHGAGSASPRSEGSSAPPSSSTPARAASPLLRGRAGGGRTRFPPTWLPTPSNRPFTTVAPNEKRSSRTPSPAYPHYRGATLIGGRPSPGRRASGRGRTGRASGGGGEGFARAARTCAIPGRYGLRCASGRIATVGRRAGYSGATGAAAGTGAGAVRPGVRPGRRRTSGTVHWRARHPPATDVRSGAEPATGDGRCPAGPRGRASMPVAPRECPFAHHRLRPYRA